jgi:hypothetical protein
MPKPSDFEKHKLAIERELLTFLHHSADGGGSFYYQLSNETPDEFEISFGCKTNPDGTVSLRVHLDNEDDLEETDPGGNTKLTQKSYRVRVTLEPI